MGGETEDILFSGETEIRPGIQLLATVVDARFSRDEEPKLIYSLEIIDEATGISTESISFDPESVQTSLTFDEAEPYNDYPEGAPDFAIESFFDRYWLRNVPMSMAS